jgi:hypothetical protein
MVENVNSKFFWEMFREDKSRRNPTHFIDPVDKTTLLVIPPFLIVILSIF